MFAHLSRRSTIALLAFAATFGSADASWLSGSEAPATQTNDSRYEIAQGGCSAAASQAAAQSGGQILSVQTAQRGGQTVCIVTVLIPAQDGNRPRRQTITVPQ